MSSDQKSDSASMLQQTLETRHVTMISIGGIIGSGLFIGSSAAIALAGPAVLLSYVFAGVLILFVMRMLAELAAAAPQKGTFTEYVRLGLGDVCGFVSGWMYWYFWVIALALEALAGGAVLHLWIDLPIWLMAMGLLLLLTGLNLISTRSFGEAEFWLSSIKVVALAGFIAAGAFYLGQHLVEGRAAFGPLTAQGGFMPNGPSSVLVGISTVVFALVGAEIVTVAAAESREPATALAHLTTTLIVRLCLFFILSMFIIVAIVPWREIQPGDSPFGMALMAMGVPAVGHIMNFVVLVAVLSCLNAGFFVSSRILFTLASKGDAPGWLVQVNRRGTPVRAILAGSLVAAGALAGAILFPEEVFAFLVAASGVVMLIVYGMVGAAQIRRRYCLERSAWSQLRFRVWWFPWSSYLVLGAIAGIFLVMMLQPGSSQELWSGLLLTGAMFLIGFIRKLRKERASGKAVMRERNAL